MSRRLRCAALLVAIALLTLAPAEPAIGGLA